MQERKKTRTRRPRIKRAIRFQRSAIRESRSVLFCRGIGSSFLLNYDNWKIEGTDWRVTYFGIPTSLSIFNHVESFEKGDDGIWVFPRP